MNTSASFSGRYLKLLVISISGYLSAATPGTVHARKHWNSEETAISLLKRGFLLADVKKARIPTIIKPAGLTAERKQYLYDEIRQFVTPKYRDVTCPSP